MDKVALKAAARFLEEQHPEGTELLGSSPRLYKRIKDAGLPLTARIHIAMQAIPRKDRYAVLSAWLDREISSTKDLSVGEALAVIRLLERAHDG